MRFRERVDFRNSAFYTRALLITPSFIASLFRLNGNYAYAKYKYGRKEK